MRAGWRRWAIGAAVGVVLMAIAGMVAFHRLVDSDSIARIAQERARSSWGRELAAESISLDLFPRPSVRARGVTISNPEWAKEPHFLAADTVAANFELLPLLTGKVRVQNLYFERPVVTLESGPEGTNFPRRIRERPDTEERVPLPSLNDIRIRDGTVRMRRDDGDVFALEIPQADLTSDGGLKDIEIDGVLRRNAQELKVKARLADASRMGRTGATSEGRIEVAGKSVQAVAEGRIPLHRALGGHDVQVAIEAQNLNEAFAFAGRERQPTAPFRARFRARAEGESTRIDALDVSLGKLRVTGHATLLPGDRLKVSAKLASDRLDWAQVFLDSGGVRVPDPPTDKLYSDRPMAWRFLHMLRGKEGTVDVALKSARLRNGLELTDAQLKLAFRDDNLEVNPFTAQMLGGSARGEMAFTGARKGVRIRFEGKGLVLERWLKERGSKIPFTGGPMAINASITGAGESMQDVASSITGPVVIRMGRGTWHSQRAGEVETLMTNAFAAKDARNMEFVCLGANLPFKEGRAEAQRLVGARSDASRLVAAGRLDFREGRVELRGKVEAQKGVTIGISAIANDIVIAGPIRKPKVSLDDAGAPAAIARVGAAIATAGVTLLGTAIAEAATTKDDPCEVVFKR